MRKSIVVFLVVCVVSFFLVASVAHAQEDNKVVKFFKNLFNWPINITKKSAETVGRTVERPISGAMATASSTIDTVTGKPEKVKDIVVEPIKTVGETGYIAVEGSVRAPIEGTTETFE